jgi:hypothetical protein
MAKEATKGTGKFPVEQEPTEGKEGRYNARDEFEPRTQNLDKGNSQVGEPFEFRGK